MQLGFSSPIHLVESNLDGTFFEKLKKDIYSLRKKIENQLDLQNLINFREKKGKVSSITKSSI